MASILGRSDDNFGNFSCDTLEGRDFEKICSHVEKSKFLRVTKGSVMEMVIERKCLVIF